tara:strand:- start:1867 stop:2379 length:513 start_codon:yes stop_codon:yes gene_type:complete
MKTKFTLFLATILLSSCAVTTVLHPKFTNVETLLEINRGESLKTIINKIGFSPEDVYVQQSNGYKIVTYSYKLLQRHVKPLNINLIGSEKDGREEYSEDIHTVFFVFDKNDVLLTYITEKGRGDAKNLLIDDHKITNFKDFIGEAPIKDSKSDKGGLGLPSLPFGKKKKK